MMQVVMKFFLGCQPHGSDSVALTACSGFCLIAITDSVAAIGSKQPKAKLPQPLHLKKAADKSAAPGVSMQAQPGGHPPRLRSRKRRNL